MTAIIITVIVAFGAGILAVILWAFRDEDDVALPIPASVTLPQYHQGSITASELMMSMSEAAATRSRP
jgi:hypothetical protein